MKTTKKMMMMIIAMPTVMMTMMIITMMMMAMHAFSRTEDHPTKKEKAKNEEAPRLM